MSTILEYEQIAVNIADDLSKVAKIQGVGFVVEYIQKRERKLLEKIALLEKEIESLENDYEEKINE